MIIHISMGQHPKVRQRALLNEVMSLLSEETGRMNHHNRTELIRLVSFDKPVKRHAVLSWDSAHSFLSSATDQA